MTIKTTNSATLRTGLLILAAVLLASYLGFTAWFRMQLEEEAIEFRENLTWAIFQVQKELINTLRLSEQVAGGMSVAPDDLMLAYDILVSRIGLVRDGDGFDELRRLQSYKETLESLTATIDRIDAALAALPFSSAPMAAVLHDNLIGYEDKLQAMSLDAIHYSSDRNTMRNADIESMLNWMQVLFIGNLLIIAGAIFVAFRQTLRAYRTAFHLEEQAMERRFVEDTAERSKLEALGSLAGGIAHEINTPAQFVTTNLEFLKDAFDDLLPQDGKTPSQDDLDYYREEVPVAITQSAEGMRRIAEIVKAIKHFAHPEEGRLNRVSIADEVNNAILLTNNQTKNSVEVVADIQPDLPQVIGRPNELNQVLINLILNAAYAIEDAQKTDTDEYQQGTITISAAQTGDSIAIRVQDSGPGIPADIAKSIFNPFFTTKPVGVGTGQGLAICQRIIVNTFNGSIQVDDSVPKGACFVITLPLSKISDDAQI